MNKTTFSSRNRMASFRDAISGMRTFASSEINARIIIFAAILVLTLGFLLHVSTFEWIVLILSISIVLTLEIINSSIARVCDLYSKEYSSKIKEIKDLSASAVLVTSFAGLINGILILVPKAFNILGELTWIDVKFG